VVHLGYEQGKSNASNECNHPNDKQEQFLVAVWQLPDIPGGCLGCKRGMAAEKNRDDRIPLPWKIIGLLLVMML
jgi:hypothetical protein